MKHRRSCLITFIVLSRGFLCAAEWKPAEGPLFTRWAKDVSPARAHPEYPRPQMARKDWLSLNGLWGYAIRPRAEAHPDRPDGEILVPFPIESALSGVGKRVGSDQRLWYRRDVEVPAGWRGKRVLLHFGAVDWEAAVSVNGKEVGSHRGGYDPFTFDITGALKDSGPQEITVAVWDPTDKGTQPRGKQIERPRGIWYTPTTGIWQSVWLEPVPNVSLAGLRIVTDIDARTASVTAHFRGQGRSVVVRAFALEGEEQVAQASGPPAAGPLELRIASPKLWSPASPFLYGLRVVIEEDGHAVDEVASYFGMRKTSLGRDRQGTLRLLLNNEPLFQHGLLDQGFWPDGLYTAPTDEALRYDVEVTKRLGFNLARKHVKVEPARWYYWCDTLGLLVWQDMPSGDRYIRASDPDIERSPESAKQYEEELKAMIDALHNHPSIVMWVPFNEGWGQYDTARITSWIKKYDPTRWVNNASGWADRGVGDVNDMHSYPGPSAPRPENARAIVLGEYGGLGLPLAGHTWQAERNWGYRSFKTNEALTAAYVSLIENLRPLIQSPGLSAAVYTQTTDVEIEVNGLLTYDRAVIKPDAERVTAVNRKVFLPPPRVEIVVPSSRENGQTWRYTTEAPSDGWQDPKFDDSGWKNGTGGFGNPTTPGSVVRTEWRSNEIWMRRAFEMPEGLRLKSPRILLHHDEDAEVYLNGVLAVAASGYTSAYQRFDPRPEAIASLTTGRNVIAIRCKQTSGGQYIDAGIEEFVEQGN